MVPSFQFPILSSSRIYKVLCQKLTRKFEENGFSSRLRLSLYLRHWTFHWSDLKISHYSKCRLLIVRLNLLFLQLCLFWYHDSPVFPMIFLNVDRKAIFYFPVSAWTKKCCLVVSTCNCIILSIILNL